MSKHTPGPWSLHEYQNGYPTLVRTAEGKVERVSWEYSIGAGDILLGHAKASTGGGGFPKPRTREEAEANARLMAAAPELLEALKRLASVCELADIKSHIPGHLALAREAIAKATGTTTEE